MGLFTKEISTDSVSVEDLQEKITSLEAKLKETGDAFADSQVALTETSEALATANATLKQFEQVEQLTAKSAELGFTGNVKQILIDSDYDMGTAMGSLITAFSAETATRTETFIETADEGDDGDAGEDLDEVEPKTKAEAMQIVRVEQDLKGRALIEQCTKLYPSLWS